MKSKPRRPPEPPDDSEYDSGDPYSCIAAGVKGVGEPSMFYRVNQCFPADQSDSLRELMREDPDRVKVALYDLWNSGRYHKTMHEMGTWAARQMAWLGDKSLMEYDRKVPPEPK